MQPWEERYKGLSQRKNTILRRKDVGHRIQNKMNTQEEGKMMMSLNQEIQKAKMRSLLITRNIRLKPLVESTVRWNNNLWNQQENKVYDFFEIKK